MVLRALFGVGGLIATAMVFILGTLLIIIPEAATTMTGVALCLFAIILMFYSLYLIATWWKIF